MITLTSKVEVMLVSTESREVTQKTHLEKFDDREIFDDTKTPSALSEKIQECVDSIVSNTRNTQWDEDGISRAIVDEVLKILSGYKIVDNKKDISISKFDIEAYKITGKPETKHGDIAIIVSRPHPSGENLVGIAFYEAKGSCHEGDRYPAFKKQQLNTLVANTEKLSYLFYDKSPKIADNQAWPLGRPATDDDYAKRKKYHVTRIDAKYLQANGGIPDDSHNRQTFGYHFVYGVLSGRDLIRNKKRSTPIINSINHWVKVTRQDEPYVISVAIQEDITNPISAQIDLPGFEKIELSRLIQPESKRHQRNTEPSQHQKLGKKPGSTLAEGLKNLQEKKPLDTVENDLL